MTQIHGIRPDQKQNVAEHMLHRVAMAEMHYRYNEKQSNTVKCSSLLREVMTQPSASATVGEDQQQPVEGDQQSVHVPERRTVVDLPETSQTSPYKKRITWSEEDRELVRLKFKDFIRLQERRRQLPKSKKF